MPRVKKTTEDEPEPKPVRRTRQTSSVTDSPVRRSTRNKPRADSSPESVKETIIAPKRVLRKRTPSPEVEVPKTKNLRKRSPTSDLDVSSQPTRTLRKRQIRSESEAPPTPPRVTRRTRANSVTENTKVESKKSVSTSKKGRSRLVSVPTEPSLVEEDQDDIETSEKSSDRQNSSQESFDKTDSLHETTGSCKEEEIEESSSSLDQTAPAEDSILIIDEVAGVKSVVSKQKKYSAIEKRLMNRIMSDKLNDSSNDSFTDLKSNKVFKPKKLQVQMEEDAEEKVEVEQESDKEVFKEKTPRRSSGKRSSGKHSFGGENEVDISSYEEKKKETPHKSQTPNKSKTPNKNETPSKTPNKVDTPKRMDTPGKSPTPNKSKTPKNRSSLKRSSNEFTVEENQDLIDETKDQESSVEAMDVDETDPSSKNESDHESESESKETLNVPERMNRDFKPRKSMIETTSEKHSVSKSRYSLGNKKLESVTFDPAKEKEKHLERKNRKSLQKINSESANFESKSAANDLSSDESDFENSSKEKRRSVEKRKSSSEKRNSTADRRNSQENNLMFESDSSADELISDKFVFESPLAQKRRSSIEKRKSFANNLFADQYVFQSPSTSDKRKSSSERRDSSSKRKDSYPPSNSPSSIQLSVTPEKDELTTSNSNSLSKSSEKNNKKRKRESLEVESSFQLTMLGYDDESFQEKDVGKLDSSSIEERSDEGNSTLKTRKSLTKRKSKSLNVNEFSNKDEESVEKIKTPKSVGKKKRHSEDLREQETSEFRKKERTPKNENKSHLMSESSEEQNQDSKEERVNHEETDSHFEENMDSEKHPDKNQKRRSKSKSFGGVENKTEEMETAKKRKSLNKRSMSRSLSKDEEFEQKEVANLQKPSDSEETIDSDSEDSQKQKSKPVITNIEVLQEAAVDEYLHSPEMQSNSEEEHISEKTPSKLKKSKASEEKLKEAEESGEFSEEESSLSSDEEDQFSTIKKARKSRSIGTTPTLTPRESRFETLKDLEESGRTSRTGKNISKNKSLESKIPAFMVSQTSSEDEDDEEESMRSIDSDIAREYNLDGRDISHYSDDDVPADVCRASESEHSDPEDDGSDLADFIDDEEEEEEESAEDEEMEEEEEEEKEEEKEIDEKEEEEVEEDSDTSVFEKSPKVSKAEVVNEIEVEKEEKKLSPPKGAKSKSRRSTQNITATDVDEQIQELEEKIANGEKLIQEKERKVQENEKYSPEVVSSSDESEIEISTDHEEEKPVEVETKPTRKAREGSSEIEEPQEKPRKNKKKKRELKSTASKTPVASSTRYGMSDSEEEPECLSFANARAEELKTLKKKTESIKASKDMKNKRKKSQTEKAKEAVESKNIKRLPDEILQDLEEVPRPKKRQRVSKEEDFITPSLGMHDRRYSTASKPGLTSASACGSTTEFEIVSLKKESKKSTKTQSSLALKWFRQRMLARNNRQPMTSYLSHQQKRRAAGKDHF